MPDRAEGEQPRPEVVQAVSDALMSLAPSRLEAIEGSITPAEQAQAEHLFAAELEASQDYRDRRIRAWQILSEQPWPEEATWRQIFDLLTPRAAALGDLYEALPDGARAEYDRRYGCPLAT